MSSQCPFALPYDGIGDISACTAHVKGLLFGGGVGRRHLATFSAPVWMELRNFGC
ncbi:hypothetical protein BD414DRAFT_141532 [Trametes punicea]|nr:hypothetical protein BD414DRAFT_141532 [Trametes punicea]